MTLILDDHPLSRQGLCSVLGMYKAEEEIHHAGTVRQAVSLMQSLPIDTVFVDLILGKENGFDFIRWLRKHQRNPKIVIITSSSRQSDFDLALELQVDAYLLKDSFIDEIVFGLKSLDRGGKFFSASLMDGINKIQTDERILRDLSPRELEVFSQLGQGLTNAQIGKRMFISEGTVKKHISSILSKLQLASRVEAALYANRNSYLMRMSYDQSIAHDQRKGGASGV